MATKSPARVDDQTLILADIATKARAQVTTFLTEILLKHHNKGKADALALLLSEGRWTHDFPITVQAAQKLGLPVSTDLPPLVYELMVLYPQGRTEKPSVLYVPFRPDPTNQERPTRGVRQTLPNREWQWP